MLNLHGLTTKSINAFGAFFVAAGMLVTGVYAVWKNTYVSKKARLQKDALQEQKLIKK